MSGSDRVYEKIIENERGTILASKKKKKKKTFGKEAIRLG